MGAKENISGSPLPLLVDLHTQPTTFRRDQHIMALMII